MTFDDLDAKMRVFETSHDSCVLPELYIAARTDGRCFTRLTKETHQFKAPYDAEFRDHMVATVWHLMDCGFRVIYGYTQSDEISLLLHRDESAFQRKLRKLNSILAAEASAKFSLLLGDLGTFDCRISQLPTVALVLDYFRWRQEDAHRNALNAHCYWSLRRAGKGPGEATRFLLHMSVAEKNEFLFSQGTNFNDLPGWQRRGIGVYWEEFEREGRNPLTGEAVLAKRRRLKTDMELPMKDDYNILVGSIVADSECAR